MERKLMQFKMFKIGSDRLIEKNGKNIIVKDIELDYLSEASIGNVVSIQQNQLTNQLRLELRLREDEFSDQILLDKIIGITISTSGRIAKETYKKFCEVGFTAKFGKKSVHFVHFITSASNLRNNSVFFIAENLKTALMNRLMCGLSYEDFGIFSPAKVNAYLGLNLSGMHILPENLSPRFIVVDDYEKIKPHTLVNHVTTKPVRYFCAEDRDIIINELLKDYTIVTTDDSQIAIRNNDGAKFSIHSGFEKVIKEVFYDEIEDSPCINSFDGQGLMHPDWAQKVAEFLGINGTISTAIVRAPWIKGMLANVDFHAFAKENDVSTIKDMFGIVHKITEIDVILTKSQVKMYKIYQNKFEKSGNIIGCYEECRRKLCLRWGITRANYRKDKDFQLTNYQFLQSLNIDYSDIDDLCFDTDTILKEINSPNQSKSYKAIKTLSDEDSYIPLYQQVLECNFDFMENRWVREQIFSDSKSKLENAKLSKIFISGNYQIIISDPIAFMQHCFQLPVNGVVPQGYCYSAYWMNKCVSEIATLRSPFIDKNEVLRLKVLHEGNKYFKNLTTGIIYSIHSLDTLAQSGCDFDGDGVASTDNTVILKGSLSREQCRPLYYELPQAFLSAIDEDSLISAEKEAFNSKVGQISNRSCALYAMMTDYDIDSYEYNYLYSGIIKLGENVGAEIDRAKSLSKLQTDLMFCEIKSNFALSEQNAIGIIRHNNIAKSCRPYFLRYKYPSMQTYDTKLKNCYKKMAQLKCGLPNLEDLIERVDSKTASFEMILLYNDYLSNIKTLNQSCVCNQIAWRYEELEKVLKQTINDVGGHPMLKDFADSTNINSKNMEKVKMLVDAYQSNKRLRTKTTMKNGLEIKSAKNLNAQIKDTLRSYYMTKIEEVVGTDNQTIFDYIVSCTTEEIAYDLLHTRVLEIIKKR